MHIKKSLALMQPYFFPYIGYWQLISSVDLFVVYDDVNYIKQGYINRNRLTSRGSVNYITLQLEGASSNRLINEVSVGQNREKLVEMVRHFYSKSNYFNECFDVVCGLIMFRDNNLARYLYNSIKGICEYLDINTHIVLSSENCFGKQLRSKERVIEICKGFGAERYINSIGGTKLYSKDEFNTHGVCLEFLRSGPLSYKQDNNEFVPNLSIIDVMMRLSREEIIESIKSYTLE